MIYLAKYRFFVIWRLLLAIIFLITTVVSIIIVLSWSNQIIVILLAFIPSFLLCGYLNWKFSFRIIGNIALEGDCVKVSFLENRRKTRLNHSDSLTIFHKRRISESISNRYLVTILEILKYFNPYIVNGGERWFERIKINDNEESVIIIKSYEDRLKFNRFLEFLIAEQMNIRIVDISNPWKA